MGRADAIADGKKKATVSPVATTTPPVAIDAPTLRTDHPADRGADPHRDSAPAVFLRHMFESLCVLLQFVRRHVRLLLHPKIHFATR
jgi:hypothetical protein